jgi:lipoate-protein ligase A
MERSWRLLDLPTDSYAESTMALSPALARARKEGLVPDTVAAFTFRQPSVVMGYYISPDFDLDLDFCRRNGIVVKRVPTQGLIFGHLDYLMMGLYIHRQFLPDEMPEIFRKVNEGIARRIEKVWDIRARHRPLNDLEIEVQGKWKKIGPHSLSFDGEIAIERIGLTVSPIPMHLAERAIVLPPEKFADKEAKTISERVGSLEEGLGRKVSIAEAKDLMIGALEETFEVYLKLDKLTETEMEYERYFSRLYDNEGWFFEKSAQRRFSNLPLGAKVSHFVHKVAGGPMIRASLCLHQGHIHDILYTGNMQPAQREMPEEMEKALRQAPALGSEIESILRKTWQEKKMVIAGARVEDFITATLGALRNLEYSE